MVGADDQVVDDVDDLETTARDLGDFDRFIQAAQGGCAAVDRHENFPVQGAPLRPYALTGDRLTYDVRRSLTSTSALRDRESSRSIT